MAKEQEGAAPRPAPNPQAAPPQIQLDESKVSAAYANFCRVTGTPEEVLLDFGLNPEPMGYPKNPVKISERIVLNYFTAKRLLLALSMSVKRHEEAFGPLEIDIQKRFAAIHPPAQEFASLSFMHPRLSTGVPGLDERLGGGLFPGTLTVIVGATGIGKTQLGLQFANAGEQQEGVNGVLYDLSSRGDAQAHAEYAQRMFDWPISPADPTKRPDLEGFFLGGDRPGDYLHVFDRGGRRVTKRDLDFDAWQDWQAQLNERLEATIAFFYGNFIRGVRRVVIDGVEPVDRPGDSIQFEMFEYVYHQILRKDPDWVARDLFRQLYRHNAASVAEHPYVPASIGCLLLVTSQESLLDDLLDRRLDEGDVLSNANTLIYLGKLRRGNAFGRGLYIAKHRGSACSDEIIPYRIDDRGLHVE